MLKKRVWYIFFILIFIIFIKLSESQSDDDFGVFVAGFVIDENNQPLKGVQVIVKGTDIKAVTDFSGQYILQTTKKINGEDVSVGVPFGKQTLQYFLVGYETKEVKVELKAVKIPGVGGGTMILDNVRMKPVSISEPIPISEKKETTINAYFITIKDSNKLVFPNNPKYSSYNRNAPNYIAYRTVFTKQDEPVEVYDNTEVIYTLPFGSGTRNEKIVLRYERGSYTDYSDYGILIRVFYDSRKEGKPVSLSPAQKEIVPGVVRIAKNRKSVKEGIVGDVFKKADQKIKEGKIIDAVYDYYELLKEHYGELDENERLIVIYKIAELDYRSLGMIDRVVRLDSDVKFSDNVVNHLMFLKGVSFLNKDVEKITIDDCKNSLGFFESVKNFDGKIPDGIRLGRINSGDRIDLLALIGIEECAATILVEEPNWKGSDGKSIVEIGEQAFNQHLNENLGEGQKNWIKIQFANFLTIIVRNEVQAGVFKSSNYERAKGLYKDVVDFYGKQGVISDKNIRWDKPDVLKGKQYILSTAQIGLNYLENGVEIYTNSMLKTLFKQAEENAERLKAEKAPKTLFSYELLDPSSEYYLFSLDKGIVDFSIRFSNVLLTTINPGVGFRELVRGNIGPKLSSDTMRELGTAENLGRIGVCAASLLRNEILCENAGSITESLSDIKKERDLFVKKYKGAVNIGKNLRDYYPDVDEKWLYSGKNICGEQRCEYLKTEDGREFFIDPTDVWAFLKSEPSVNIGGIGEKIGWIFGNANPVMKAAVERESLAREKGIYLDKQRVDELTLKMACDYRKLGLSKTALGLLESIKDSDVSVECSFYTGTKKYNARELSYEIEGEGVFNLADDTVNGLISYDTASSIIVASPVWVYGANKINEGVQLLAKSRAGEKVTLAVSKGFLNNLQKISSSYNIVRASILNSLKNNKILFKGGEFVIETSEKSFELAGRVADEVFEEVVGETLRGVHPLLGAIGEMAVGSKSGLSATAARSYAMRNLNYQFGRVQSGNIGYNLEGKKVVWNPTGEKVKIEKISENGFEFSNGEKIDNLLDLQNKINFDGLKISDVRKDIKKGSKYDADLNTELSVWIRYVDQDLFRDLSKELEASEKVEIGADLDLSRLKPEMDYSVVVSVLKSDVDISVGRKAVSGIVDAIHDSLKEGYKVDIAAAEGHALKIASSSLPVEPTVSVDVIGAIPLIEGKEGLSILAGSEAKIGRVQCSQLCKFPILGIVTDKPERGAASYKSLEKIKFKDLEKLSLNRDFAAIRAIMTIEGTNAVNFLKGASADSGVYVTTDNIEVSFFQVAKIDQVTSKRVNFLFLQIGENEWIGVRYGGVTLRVTPDLEEIIEEYAPYYLEWRGSKEKKKDIEEVRLPESDDVLDFNREVVDAIAIMKRANYKEAFIRFEGLFNRFGRISEQLKPLDRLNYLSNFGRAAQVEGDTEFAVTIYRLAMQTKAELGNTLEFKATREDYMKLIKDRYGRELYAGFNNNLQAVNGALLKAIDDDFNFASYNVKDFLDRYRRR